MLISDCSGRYSFVCLTAPTLRAAVDELAHSPIACRKPGATSAQPINRSGPTASKAAFPYSPTMKGSATFNASVTKLAKISSLRAGRSASTEAPARARCRIPSSSPRIERSTAGATSGATHTGTPRRSARLSTLPKPNRNVNLTTEPMIPVTARRIGSADVVAKLWPRAPIRRHH